MSIQACVDEYIRRFRTGAREEIGFYMKQSTLSDAIRVAATCQSANGKRHPHQRRIPGTSLRKAKQQLLEHQEALRAAQNFAELYAVIVSKIGLIRGIGELAIYDIAHRIGAFLGFEPDEVYLHAGTRAGAKALGYSGRLIKKDELPPEFAPLTAAEIEDCLCIYKDAFGGHDPPSASCVGKIGVSACVLEANLQKRGC